MEGSLAWRNKESHWAVSPRYLDCGAGISVMGKKWGVCVCEEGTGVQRKVRSGTGRSEWLSIFAEGP